MAGRRDRPGRAAVPGARHPALPRAQELRAGDEDHDGERRHDPPRHPQAAGARARQREGQHGLAAPDHERGKPRRVRGAARCGGPAGAPARKLRLGHVRRRQHGRGDRVHGDARAGGRVPSGRLRAERRAARLRSLPVHRGRGRRGAPLRPALALHRRRRRQDRRRSAREAQMQKDAVRAYELVYGALGGE